MSDVLETLILRVCGMHIVKESSILGLSRAQKVEFAANVRLVEHLASERGARRDANQERLAAGIERQVVLMGCRREECPLLRKATTGGPPLEVISPERLKAAGGL